MSELCPSYDRIASPGNSQRFPLEFDGDHNGCINPLEGAKIPPDAFLDLLSQSVSDSLVTENAERVHETAVIQTKLIQTYGIGHIAEEYPDEMAPRGCLPGIIADEDDDPPSINSLLQLMFPELNYFGVEDGELMTRLAMQAAMQIMVRREEVQLRFRQEEIDESQAQKEDKNLVLEGTGFMATEGKEKRDRAMAKNLLRALEATKAQVILYPVGANHAPRIFRWLERSSTVSVLTLAPQDLIYTKGEASFKED